MAVPPDSARPCSASTPRPAVDRPIASQAVRLTRVRSSSSPRTGVNTTYMPVTKPETEAEVCCRPEVWSTCATP